MKAIRPIPQDWSILLQAGQDQVEQVRGDWLFQRLSGGDRVIDNGKRRPLGRLLIA